MRNGWVTKRLGDVAKTQYGLSESMNAEGQGFKIFRMGEVQDGQLIDTGRMKYADISRKEFEQYKLRTGDVLFNRTNSFELVGKTGIFALEGDYCFASYLVRVNLDRSKVLPEFLNYFMNSDRFQESVKGKASQSINQANINATILSNELIRFPESLAEQQRIVDLLDEAFAGLATAQAHAEKNLQNARALFDAVLCHSVIGETPTEWRDAGRGGKATADSDLKSLFRQIAATDRKPVRSEETTGHEAITDLLPKEWRHASIGQLFILIDYRGKTAAKSGSGHRLITARNIRMGFLSEEPVTFISKEQYKKWMVRGFPKLGDIFFVTEGHTMGFVALNTRTDEFALAQRTITLQPPVPFSTRFFFYFMLSSHFQKLVKLNATGAAAVGMKASKFRSLPLAFPSFAEQEIIAAKLDSLREETQRLATLYTRKLAALEALKKSLLHQAFTGQL